MKTKEYLKNKLIEKQNLLTMEELKHKLLYVPETGLFLRNCIMTKSSIGSVCGTKTPSGYIILTINRRFYRAHRVAWFYTYGKWPIGDVDHINKNRSDNRIENLREASRSENLCNMKTRSDNSTGVRGVGFNKISKNYHARVQLRGKLFQQNGFKTLESAKEFVMQKRQELHGSFFTA